MRVQSLATILPPARKCALLSLIAFALLLCAGKSAKADTTNLLVNGDFAVNDGGNNALGWTFTPAGVGSYFWYDDGFDLSSYGLGNSVSFAVFAGTGNFFNDGNRYAAPAAADFDTISQGVATAAGQTYTLSFWLKEGGDAGTSGDFKVLWDGNQVLEIPPYTDWAVYPYSLTLTGTGSDTLAFAGYDVIDTYGLMAVSLTADAAPTPEPGSLLLLGTGLVGLAGFARRKFRKA